MQLTIAAVVILSTAIACKDSSPAPSGSAAPAATVALADRARALRQQIREQPTSGRLHHELALVYFDMSEDAAGKAALFRAMALTPDDPAVVASINEFTGRMAPIHVDEADAARDRFDAADRTAAAGAVAAPPPIAHADPPAAGGDDDVGGGPVRAPAVATARGATATTGGPAAGHYKCYASINGATQYIFIDFDITGDGTYRDKQGTSGTYRFDRGSKKLAFEGGSLAGYNAALLGPAKVGIAEKPRTFYNTVCDRKQ